MVTFNLAVTGRQKGQVYILAQASLATANVTLTCGTPVDQLLSQAQQCPTTAPTSTALPEGAIFNSSLACTRGAQQTYHNLDCKDHYSDGGERALSILRVFYGATPISR